MNRVCLLCPKEDWRSESLYLLARKLRLPLLPRWLLPWLLERAPRLLRLQELLLARWLGRPLAASLCCWTWGAVLPHAIQALPRAWTCSSAGVLRRIIMLRTGVPSIGTWRPVVSTQTSVWAGQQQCWPSRP